MTVLKVIVDEVPESCGDCGFCTRYKDMTGRGYCMALPEERNDVCTEYYAKYRRHDCPLQVVSSCCPAVRYPNATE